MGTLAARQLEEGRGAEKAEGQGFGSRERVAPLMDMTMDDLARRRFELRSDFPRIRTQPRTGPVYWVAVA